MSFPETSVLIPTPDLGQGAAKGIAQNDGVVIGGCKGRDATRQNVTVGGDIHQRARSAALRPRRGVSNISLQTGQGVAESGGV